MARSVTDAAICAACSKARRRSERSRDIGVRPAQRLHARPRSQRAQRAHASACRARSSTTPSRRAARSSARAAEMEQQQVMGMRIAGMKAAVVVDPRHPEHRRLGPGAESPRLAVCSDGQREREGRELQHDLQSRDEARSQYGSGCLSTRRRSNRSPASVARHESHKAGHVQDRTRIRQCERRIWSRTRRQRDRRRPAAHREATGSTTV